MKSYKKTALIGYTGFVGGNLNYQYKFSDLYNSKNIQEIEGKSYDLVVCAGTRSEMWLINQNSKKDLEEINSLIKSIKKTKIKQFVLISTIAVYPNPVDINENTSINSKKTSPYGQNRFYLEEFCQKTFDTLIIRLPGLFGQGLKKNAIYDLLNNHMIESIHADSVYQFYDLLWLWRDISKSLEHNLKLVNFATEPTSIEEITKDCFNINFTNRPKDNTPAFCNFKSNHYKIYNGENGYMYPKKVVKKNLRRFIKNYKSK